MSNIAKSIKIARAIRGVTQRELALDMNVSHNTVSSWETADLSATFFRVERICVALDFPLILFLQLSEDVFWDKLASEYKETNRG